MDSYKYQPLEGPRHIRLLRLSEKQSEDQAYYEIYQESLESLRSTFPRYAALSYTWGTPEFNRSIVVNGYRLDVTENLYAALHNLKLGALSIWIDAVCINQRDDLEKSTQIPLMAEIYANATGCVIWLGEESEDSNLAIQFILDLREIFNTGGEIMDEFIFAFRGATPKYAKTRARLQELADAGRLVQDSPECAAVGKLLDRPWFKRAWIIQEVSKSSNQLLCCGSNSIQWYIFSEFCDHISKLGLLPLFAPPNGTASLFRPSTSAGVAHVSIMKMLNTEQGSIGTKTWIHNGQFGKGEQSTLINLIRLTKNFQATDSRDHLYALLGLAVDGHHPRIAADYRLSVAEVYIRSAIYFLEEQDAVWILYRAHGSNNDSSLPSWVPDWRKDPSSLFHSWRWDFKHPYCADDLTKPNVRIDHVSRKLTIAGVHFDNIKEVSSPCAPNADAMERVHPEAAMFVAVLNFFNEAMEIVGKTLQPSDPRSQALDVLWRTLCGNVAKHRHPAPDYWKDAFAVYQYWHILQLLVPEEGETKFEEYRQVLLEHQDKIAAALPDGSDKETEWETYMSQFREATLNQRFCMTEKRRSGLVNREARPGDLLVILFGGHVPFVLRPCEGSDSEYTLVGEAYVHGCMHGEALDSGKSEVKEFTVV